MSLAEQLYKVTTPTIRLELIFYSPEHAYALIGQTWENWYVISIYVTRTDTSNPFRS